MTVESMLGFCIDGRSIGWRKPYAVAQICHGDFSLFVVTTAASADEGMWTFDNFPSAAVNAKYLYPYRPGLAGPCAGRRRAVVVGLFGLCRVGGRGWC